MGTTYNKKKNPQAPIVNTQEKVTVSGYRLGKKAFIIDQHGHD